MGFGVKKCGVMVLSEHGRGGGVSPLAMPVGACAGWLVAIVTGR
jgi:hypothetical protein